MTDVPLEILACDSYIDDAIQEITSQEDYYISEYGKYFNIPDVGEISSLPDNVFVKRVDEWIKGDSGVGWVLRIEALSNAIIPVVTESGVFATDRWRRYITNLGVDSGWEPVELE